MTKPIVVPWDSGLANIVAVTGTHQTSGYVTSEIPTSGEANALFNNFYLWCAFVDSLFSTSGQLLENFTQTDYRGYPDPIPGSTTNIAYGTTLVTGDAATNPSLIASGVGGAIVDLRVPAGRRLTSITVFTRGSGSGGVQLGVMAAPITAGPWATIAFQTGTSSTSGADTTVLCYATLTASAGTTLTTGGSTGAYTLTRSSGSFITDNFQVGQIVATTGFTNAGNNTSGGTVTAVTATVLTINVATTPVVETKTSVAKVETASSLGGTQSIYLSITAAASGMGLRALRVTYSK